MTTTRGREGGWWRRVSSGVEIVWVRGEKEEMERCRWCRDDVEWAKKKERRRGNGERNNKDRERTRVRVTPNPSEIAPPTSYGTDGYACAEENNEKRTVLT